MAYVKKGTLTVVANTTAQNLNLGFAPSYFRMMNKTKIAATTNGVVIAEWYNDMANATANIWTTSASDGTIKLTRQATNGFTPFSSTDTGLFVPAQAPYNATAGEKAYIGPSTNLVITGISQAANASVTATHSFTSADIGVTTVTFHGVPGMTQINTLRGIVQSVTSTTSFTVNINSSSFSAYNSGGLTAGLNTGFANVVTGAPANTLYSTVSLPTAQANLGQIGLTLGTALMVDINDVWEYVAMLDTPANA